MKFIRSNFLFYYFRYFLTIIKKFTNNKKCAFWKACYLGNLEICRYLVSTRKIDPNSHDGDEDPAWNRSPIDLASRFSHLDLVRFLALELKVKPIVFNGRGATPLSVAAQEV